MARVFDGIGSGDHLRYDTAVRTGPPFTLAAWFRSITVNNNQALLSLASVISDYNSFVLIAMGGVLGDPIQARQYDGAVAFAQTTTGFSANTWHHAAGV